MINETDYDVTQDDDETDYYVTLDDDGDLSSLSARISL
jgi:hypothetical protein